MAAIIYNNEDRFYPEDSLVGANSIDEYKGHDATISGHEGNDVILNHGHNVLIGGGTDNDTIVCRGEGLELIEYTFGDDVIYNFFDDEGRATPESDYLGECIYIASGDSVKSSYLDGADFVLKIGDGSITLKDATGKNIEIQTGYLHGGSGIYTKIKVADYRARRRDRRLHLRPRISLNPKKMCPQTFK